MQRLVAVIGAGECDAATAERAAEVGTLLARAGCTVVTGGLGGVMRAASRGAKEAGALVLAVLPGTQARDANPYVDVAIATGMGEARNVILVHSAQALIAVGGGYGTLSELALALRHDKPIAALDSWDVDPRIERVATPGDAVASVLCRLPPR